MACAQRQSLEWCQDSLNHGPNNMKTIIIPFKLELSDIRHRGNVFIRLSITTRNAKYPYYVPQAEIMDAAFDGAKKFSAHLATLGVKTGPLKAPSFDTLGYGGEKVEQFIELIGDRLPSDPVWNPLSPSTQDKVYPLLEGKKAVVEIEATESEILRSRRNITLK